MIVLLASDHAVSKIKTTRVIIPVTIVVPAILLVIYYFFIRFFVQIRHIIEQSIEYRGDATKNLVVCATDAGYLGYYSRHTVINVDGIVNNRAKDYILLGRFSEYVKLAGCDDVMVEARRMKFYDRNMPQSSLTH